MNTPFSGHVRGSRDRVGRARARGRQLGRGRGAGGSALGCERDDALPHRVGHEAAHRDARRSSCSISTSRPASGPTTSASATCSRTRAATTANAAICTRFGYGRRRPRGCVAELPCVRRFLGVEQVWSYANTGYWLAGHLAAERAGTTFEDALAARVLGPAGLEATSFDEPELDGTGSQAAAGPYPRARRPSGGLVSNVPDLLRFGRWHLAQPDSARLRVVAGKPTAGVYGLGLAGERVGGVEVWGHPGSYGGFQSSLLVVPERGAVFAGLTNSSTGRAGAARARGCLLRAGRRRPAATAGTGRAARGGPRLPCRSVCERRRTSRSERTRGSSSSPSRRSTIRRRRSASGRSRSPKASQPASGSTSRSRASPASASRLAERVEE